MLPGTPAPALELETLDHGGFDLASDAPANGTVLVFYRGLHCPICMRQLKEVDGLLDQFAALETRVIAVSSDDAARTVGTKEKSGVKNLILGHSMSLEAARSDWGLYLSAGRPETAEPPLFHEPGLFWVKGDGSFYFASIQTMPFVRSSTAGLLAGIKYVTENNYPVRGNYTGPV